MTTTHSSPPHGAPPSTGYPPSTGRRRARARTLPAVALLLAGALLTACSDDGGGASASSSSGASSGSSSGGGDASPTSQFDQALAYSQCMRDNGVPGFPDPKQNTGIQLTPGSGVDPESDEFKAAEETCRDKNPQGLGGGGEPLDAVKVADWAQCIRDNGLPDFPDPEIEGGSMVVDFGESGIDPQSGEFEEARQACQDKWPGGGMRMKAGPR